MEVPKIVKIVVNMGVGEAVGDIKQLERAIEDLRAITGQQPAVSGRCYLYGIVICIYVKG